VHGGEVGSAERAGKELASGLGDFEGLAEQGLSSGGAEADDDLRLDQLDLGAEPREAGLHLAVARLLMDATPRRLQVRDPGFARMARRRRAVRRRLLLADGGRWTVYREPPT
jgi:hypothetical protein